MMNPVARISMLFLLAWLPVACASTGADSPQATSVEISFVTTDGVTVHGDLYMAGPDKAAPLILLFHQAGGDSRGEYGPIIPRLLKNGYNVMGMDQRVGGNRFGGGGAGGASAPVARFRSSPRLPAVAPGPPRHRILALAWS